MPADIDSDPDVPAEQRARDALLAYVESLGFHTDQTESAGFIDLFLEPALSGAFAERRFVFVAREGDSATRDVFLLRARVAPNGVPLAVGTLYNLTRTPDGDEGWLTPRPGQVAFTTRFAQLHTGITVLDLNGGRPAAGASLESIATRALTDLLEMGDWRGVEVSRFVLPEPAVDLRLQWEGDELAVSRRERGTWTEARLDLADLAQRRAPDVAWLRSVETHHAPRSLLSWAVDTARSISFIGPERIYALEKVFFRVVDLYKTARYRIFGSTSGSSAAEAHVAAPSAPPPAESIGVSDPTGPWPLERPPADLSVPLDPPLVEEGRWRPFEFKPGPPGAPPAFWRTTLRVDPERPDAITELVLADPRQVALEMVGGTEHPRSTTGEVGTGMVKVADRERTLAAFNGGFQAVHGGYGMVVDRTVLLPPVPQVATVASYADGTTLLGTWGDTPELPKGLISLRQNLPPLAELGRFNPLGRRTWGFTLKGSDPIFTWRSGLGVTRAGHLLYAVCVRCSADTLADAMVAAGADYAMHLDMNISNIGWEWWRPSERGAGGGIERQSLMVDMWRSDESRYVEPHNRDFFYLVSRRRPEPGAGAAWSQPLSGDGLPRPAGLWPPPFSRGRLSLGATTVEVLRLESAALGAQLRAVDRPTAGWCELTVHRGVSGEDLPHSTSGEPPRADRAALVVTHSGRVRLLPPGEAPEPGGFFQQLPAVIVAGRPTGAALPGPERWLLGEDATGALYVVGGAVDMAPLLEAALALDLKLAVAPTPSGGAPALTCAGKVMFLFGKPPLSPHHLVLARAPQAPRWPLGHATGGFPDRN